MRSRKRGFLKVFRNFIFVVFLFIGSFFVAYSMSPSERLDMFRRELNGEFHLPLNTDICTLVVTRTPTQVGPLSQISRCEFENLLGLLCAACGAPETSTHFDECALLDKDVNGDLIKLSKVEERSIATAKQQISRYFADNRLWNVSKLVIFNEMFFSQIRPLEDHQRKFIEENLFALSNGSPYAILYPNFLYTEQRKVSGEDINSAILKMQNSINSGTMVIAPNSLKRCATMAGSVPNNESIFKHMFLINETHSINRGRILTRCKKHGYFHESDLSVSMGVLYDSGIGCDEPQGEHSSLQDILLRNITTDIYLDLNLGTRIRNKMFWCNTGVTYPCDSRLHIVQSNSIDPFYNPRNAANLPKQRGILHADKFPHPSWNSPSVNRPQDVFLPYYDGKQIVDDIIGIKNEIHLRFVGNDYRFTFMQI